MSGGGSNEKPNYLDENGNYKETEKPGMLRPQWDAYKNQMLHPVMKPVAESMEQQIPGVKKAIGLTDAAIDKLGGDNYADALSAMKGYRQNSENVEKRNALAAGSANQTNPTPNKVGGLVDKVTIL
jgi:hypothetical protein